MARVKWAGGNKPVCRSWKHKKVLINANQRNNQGTFKVFRCSVCGATGVEKVS